MRKAKVRKGSGGCLGRKESDLRLEEEAWRDLNVPGGKRWGEDVGLRQAMGMGRRLTTREEGEGGRKGEKRKERKGKEGKCAGAVAMKDRLLG